MVGPLSEDEISGGGLFYWKVYQTVSSR